MRRSVLIVSGIVSTIGMPRAAHTMASAIPVLPLVGSTTIVSGPMSPAAWAASIIETPMRSLTLLAGLKNSSLATTCAGCAVSDLVDADQGGVADELGDVVGDAHDLSSQSCSEE